MTDTLEILSLAIAIIALLVGVFPVRAYIIERYWPYRVTFVEPLRSGLTASQYRLYVTARNRTSKTTYFGLGWEGLEMEPTPNVPSPSIVRLVNGEQITRGSFPVGPNEQEMWIIFFQFDRPIARAVVVSLFNRPPEVPGSEEKHHRTLQFRYVIQPVAGGQVT